MSIEPGTRLGAYEILEPIGSGGMGEVYRARDAKLGRDVAVKVLPDAFSGDEERRARFEREARLLASLNHPGIATLHGLSESEGVSYLVMELVDGSTLVELVQRGRLPLDEALAIFRQIADGLDAAHQKNIVHRDLKPANIKITPEGQVKILDFGLAKAFEPETVDGDSSDSPTLERNDTRAGTVLGTPSYMSPEQARGKRVDKRTDIWAFGCCLYEVLAGKKAFGGETLSDTLSAVLRDEPDWSALPSLPPRLEPLLRHCLTKDPRRRLRDVGDALAVLEGSFGTRLSETPPASKWVAPAMVAASLAVAYLFLSNRDTTSEPSRVIRWDLRLPDGQTLAGRAHDAIALSPDGTRLVYAADTATSGNTRLYLRELNTFEAQPIVGTEGASAPFFSPDGESIGFFVADEIRRVELSGDVSTLIGRATHRVIEPHAVWSESGVIVFAIDRTVGLYRLEVSGGESERLTSPATEAGERGHRRPSLLPNGEVLFTIETDTGFRTATLSLSSREYRPVKGLGSTGPDTRYVPTGHLVYGQSGTLFAVPFDLDGNEARGAPVPVVDGVRTSLTSDFAHFTLSGGILAYLTGREEGRVVYVDREGRATPLLTEPGDFRYPNLSPDGRRLALALRGSFGNDVWVYELDRGTRTRLTSDGGNVFPVWTPDGQSVTFSNLETTFVAAADGRAPPVALEGADVAFAPHWNPDGSSFAFFTPRGDWDIMEWRDGTVTPLLDGPGSDGLPRFSPDGGWLAYMSDESGRNEIYVQAYPAPGQRFAISRDGGTEPVWSRDGREIFYRNGDRMMRVPIERDPEFRPGTPEVLFQGGFESNPGGYPNYDVTEDGRFVMIQPEATGLDTIRIVLNWHEELQALVPAGE